MAADVDLLQARPGRARDGIERADDLQVTHAGSVRRHGLLAGLQRTGGWRRPFRGVGPAEARGQAFVKPDDRGRDPVLAGGDARTELPRLAGEVLPVLEERSRPLGIERQHLERPAVDRQPDLQRLGAGRARAAEDDAEEVLTFHREAMDDVERVGKAQARHVVVGEGGEPRLDPGARGLETHQRRLKIAEAEERRARDAVRGGHVLLHEDGGQR